MKKLETKWVGLNVVDYLRELNNETGKEYFKEGESITPLLLINIIPTDRDVSETGAITDIDLLLSSGERLTDISGIERLTLKADVLDIVSDDKSSVIGTTDIDVIVAELDISGIPMINNTPHMIIDPAKKAYAIFDIGVLDRKYVPNSISKRTNADKDDVNITISTIDVIELKNAYTDEVMSALGDMYPDINNVEIPRILERLAMNNTVYRPEIAKFVFDSRESYSVIMLFILFTYLRVEDYDTYGNLEVINAADESYDIENIINSNIPVIDCRSSATMNKTVNKMPSTYYTMNEFTIEILDKATELIHGTRVMPESIPYLGGVATTMLISESSGVFKNLETDMDIDAYGLSKVYDSSNHKAFLRILQSYFMFYINALNNGNNDATPTDGFRFILSDYKPMIAESKKYVADQLSSKLVDGVFNRDDIDVVSFRLTLSSDGNTDTSRDKMYIDEFKSKSSIDMDLYVAELSKHLNDVSFAVRAISSYDEGILITYGGKFNITDSAVISKCQEGYAEIDVETNGIEDLFDYINSKIYKVDLIRESVSVSDYNLGANNSTSTFKVVYKLPYVNLKVTK